MTCTYRYSERAYRVECTDVSTYITLTILTQCGLQVKCRPICCRMRFNVIGLCINALRVEHEYYKFLIVVRKSIKVWSFKFQKCNFYATAVFFIFLSYSLDYNNRIIAFIFARHCRSEFIAMAFSYLPMYFTVVRILLTQFNKISKQI